MASKVFIGIFTAFLALYLRGIFSTRLSMSKLNDAQRAVIPAFRAAVEHVLPHHYMHEDSYLVRYLAVKNFHIEEAARQLKENLAWREEQKVDSILEEDWSDYNKRFPYELSSVNREGRPVLYYQYSKWDINNEVTNGDFDRLVRYTGIKTVEDADRRARSLRRNSSDVEQFDIIINFDGYTIENQGCLECVKFYVAATQIGESRYPMANENVFMVNAPPAFEAAYKVISQVMSDSTRQTVRVLGGRDSYEPVLLEHLAKDQFPKDLQ